MPALKNISSVLRNELPYLRKVYGVKRIALFGSYARGTQKKGSDVDLFVELEKPLGLSFMDFSDHLEKRTGRKVDIITSEGLRSIRVKKVAEDIKRGLVYV